MMVQDVTHLKKKVLELFQSGRGDPETLVEAYLEGALGSLTHEERLSLVGEMIASFRSESCRGGTGANEETLKSLHALIFGPDAPLPEGGLVTVEALSQALNQVFDSLNEVVLVMRRVLFGEVQDLQTIRTVMGSSLRGSGAQPLHEYVVQIKDCFLIAHAAFQEATKTLLARVLDEICPRNLASRAGGSLKFGPLRKAELFEAYEREHEKIRQWLDSDRFREELRREFERLCEKRFQG